MGFKAGRIAGTLQRLNSVTLSRKISSGGYCRPTLAISAFPTIPTGSANPTYRSSARNVYRQTRNRKVIAAWLPIWPLRSSPRMTISRKWPKKWSNICRRESCWCGSSIPNVAVCLFTTAMEPERFSRPEDELSGENVLPGFRCRVGDLFLPPPGTVPAS